MQNNNAQPAKQVTSSLKIAEFFGIEHNQVIRDIENINIPKDFSVLNFEAVEYFDNKGKKQKAYNVTPDGFMMLLMGFANAKAMEMKTDIITKQNLIDELLMHEANLERIKAEMETTPEIKRLRAIEKRSAEIDEQLDLLEIEHFGLNGSN